MSNRLYQELIVQMKDTIGRIIGVIDDTGCIVACSDQKLVGEFPEINTAELFSAYDGKVLRGKSYTVFGGEGEVLGVVFVDGDDEDAMKFSRLLSVTFGSVKKYHDDKFDRANFIKNLLLDNILHGDIYLKARELSFSNDTRRSVMLIRCPERNNTAVIDTISSLFPEKNKDFVLNINRNDIVLVKEIRPQTETADLEKLARSISDTIIKEYYITPRIGIGTSIVGVRELARSFKEAQISLEVGKVFDTEKTIITYENLGIARLIYQLPTTLCDMFLKEIFKRGSIENLDNETLFTIQKFFENNLNVSETSRKLFVHRNTLVYRLEKIKKLTGLDLREFDDAIVFKVALMVKKYLDARPVKY